MVLNETENEAFIKLVSNLDITPINGEGNGDGEPRVSCKMSAILALIAALNLREPKSKSDPSKIVTLKNKSKSIDKWYSDYYNLFNSNLSPLDKMCEF